MCCTGFYGGSGTGNRLIFDLATIVKLVHKDSEIDHELAVLMAAKLHNLSLVVRLPPPRHLWSVTWLYDGGDIRSWLVQGNGDTAPCAQDGCPCPAGNLPQLGQKGCLPVTSTLHGFWQMTEGVDRLDSLFNWRTEPQDWGAPHVEKIFKGLFAISRC